MPKIFESPDGGHTIYVREADSAERTLHSMDQVALDKLKENEWNKIWQVRNNNPALKKAVDAVILIYRMSKENE